MTIRAVVYDFHRTLALPPGGTIWRRSLLEALAAHGASRRRARSWRACSTRASLGDARGAARAWLAGGGAQLLRAPAGRQRHRRRRCRRARRRRRLPPPTRASSAVEPRAVPETRAVLTAVDERGIRQLVLSNHVWELPEICRAHDLVPPLTEVLTSARLGVEKPHPETYAAAIAAAGCEPHEILFVGDTYEADVAGPERAGMQALLVRRPHPEARELLRRPDRRAGPRRRGLALPWPAWSASRTSSARAP